MSSTATTTAQDSNWKVKEQAEQASSVHQQNRSLVEEASKEASKASSNPDQGTHPMDRDFEGGFGGQEDLEDRYATTSGEH
ncbi:hypothetical protein M413DRAFT_102020 [Hebeloma cylindrosporum]|uniref:Uncharacterized protein n=1 Tax=Hebeloma cylindrosporum TaxID=76867 RepID=A0A0C3CKN4_HEBCY|nr:hypothetical protein M413DRAFT_102020 [Hebeloma cylindrosporum h7]